MHDLRVYTLSVAEDVVVAKAAIPARIAIECTFMTVTILHVRVWEFAIFFK